MFIVLMSTLFGYTYAQPLEFENPDYEEIKKEIHDSTSALYYPAIMARMLALDTTLTINDYRHLYYGYIFQPQYKPYWTSDDEKKLLKYYRSEKIEEKDYDDIQQLANHSINEFPFDLRQLNYLAYIYHLKGDEAMAKKISYRFHAIVEAILSTGDGRKCETGFHVINVGHEYVILTMFELQVKMQSLVGGCDYIGLVKDERNIEGLFFNISKLKEKNLESFKFK